MENSKDSSKQLEAQGAHSIKFGKNRLKPGRLPGRVNWQDVKRHRYWLAFNLIIVGLLLSFVWLSQTHQIFNGEEGAAVNGGNGKSKTFDRTSASYIALGLATLVDYEELDWVYNQSVTSSSFFQDSQNTSPVIQKPVVVNSTVRTRDDIITNYVVSQDDTIDSLANYFLVSPDSIRWSNSLADNAKLIPGSEIVIPPSGLNGIVHQLAEDEDLPGLKKKYNFEISQALNFNDIIDDELPPAGEFIFLPNASKASARRPLPVAINQGDRDINFITLAGRRYDVGPCLAECGREIEAGAQIGKLGNTGWSTGPHLHLEVIQKSNGRALNPWIFLRNNNLVWPVTNQPNYITKGYQVNHWALDIASGEGSPILAVAPGTIIHRGCLYPTLRRFSNFAVIIDHGSYYTISIHMQAPDNRTYDICSYNTYYRTRPKSIDYQTKE